MAVKKVPAPAPAVVRAPCLCGCGITPSGKTSRFVPGHDARYHSAQRAAGIHPVRINGELSRAYKVAEDGAPAARPARGTKPKPAQKAWPERSPAAKPKAAAKPAAQAPAPVKDTRRTKRPPQVMAPVPAN